METLVLKQEILDHIEVDVALQGQIAAALGVRFPSLYRIKRDNSPKLTQFSVLQIIKEKLGYGSIEEMLEPEIIGNNSVEIQ